MNVFSVANHGHHNLFSQFSIISTVEAPISGHLREAEKVFATGAGRLRECVNTEFV